MKPAGDVGAFRDAIAELVPDLALSLGAWAERLHALVGPLRAARPEPVGDPDGFDGLTRRGLYERLTPFEWLLADEAPDEFLRRAAAGEHAFWRLSHRGPAGSRRCVALVAGGAELLGAPRLVTLAALLALARRAAEAQADFAWAFWGERGLRSYERLEADGVRHWLREGRALRGPAGAEVDRFFDERVRPASSDDAWLLGGARSAGGRAPAFARVSVAQAPDLEGRRARVLLERPGSAPRALELDLPEPAHSARWLRAPFLPPPAPIRKAAEGPRDDVGAPPAFSHDGRRLFVRLEGGDVLAHVVPNSAAAPPSGSVRLRPQRQGRLLAAAAVGRSLWGVELAGRSLWLYRFGKRGGVSWEREFSPAEGDAAPAFGHAPALATLVLRDGKPFAGPAATREPLAFLFAKPDFWALESEGKLSRPYGGAVAGLGQNQRGEGSLARVSEGGDSLLLSSWSPPVCDLDVVGLLAPAAGPPDVPTVVFGEWGRGPGVLAIEGPEGGWWVVRYTPPTAAQLAADPRALMGEAGSFFERARRIEPPPGARVLGLTHWPSPDEPALVVLGPDRRAFQFAGPGMLAELVEAPGPVTGASLSSVARALAYRTDAGLLVVRSLATGQDVLRLEPPARVS